ncbi:MAG: replicative DNA helicase [Chitinispirillales bacterium]|jgi:replicative DNA helicase|nr:replicative DNA helicase [Chitinispirillales bacterium]
MAENKHNGILNDLVRVLQRAAVTEIRQGSVLNDVRMLPQSIELEKCILASALQDEEVHNDVMEDIKEEYFYDERNKIIFEALKKLQENHKALDHGLLVEQLKEMGKYEHSGGEAYLSELLTTAATVSNVFEYSDAVKDKWILRTLIRTVTQISDACYEIGADAKKTLLDAEQKIFDIAKGESEKNAPILLKKIMKKVYDNFKVNTSSDGVTGVRTGFEELDKTTTGFHEGDFIVAGGRPGMGKTAFGISMALNMAKAEMEKFEKKEIKNVKPIVIFSLEMPSEQVVHRFLSIESGINLKNIRGGISGGEYNRVFEAGGRISNLEIFINDSAVGVSDVNSKCRRIAKEYGGLGCVMIDYLQLMLPKDSRNYNREQEVALISRSLKYLAKELSVPIVALAQVNRDVEKHKSIWKSGDGGDDFGSKPNLSDLRESGAIEQDADMVLFIHRPSYYFDKVNEKDMNDDQRKKYKSIKNKAEIIIAKQRNGPTGTINLGYIPECAKFDNFITKDDFSQEREDVF